MELQGSPASAIPSRHNGGDPVDAIAPQTPLGPDMTTDDEDQIRASMRRRTFAGQDEVQQISSSLSNEFAGGYPIRPMSWAESIAKRSVSPQGEGASPSAEIAKPMGQQPISWLASIGKQPCLLYTSPSPRDQRGSRMPSSA